MNQIRSGYWGLCLVLLLGLFLRVEAAIHTVVDQPLRADAGQYFTYAYNIVTHGVYSGVWVGDGADTPPPPDALRSPGYPLFLSLFVDGPPTDATVLAIMLWQSLLGVCLIPLTFVLARALMSPVLAVIPAVLVAVSPQLVVMSTYVLSETLFCVLLLAALVALAVLLRPGASPGWGALAGVMLGAAVLTRPTLNYLWPLLVGALIWSIPSPRRRTVVAVFMAGYCLLVLPWMTRNLVVLGVLSDSTLTVSTLIHGHYPDMMFDHRPETLGYPYRFDPEIATLSASVTSALTGIAERVLQSPLDYLRWYLIGKPMALFAWQDVSGAGDVFTYPTLASPYYGVPVFVATKQLMQVLHPVVAVMAGIWVVIAVFRLVRGGALLPLMIVVSSVWLYFIGVHMIGFPLARYAIPVLPLIFIMSVSLVHGTFLSVKKRRRSIHEHP